MPKTHAKQGFQAVLASYGVQPHLIQTNAFSITYSIIAWCTTKSGNTKMPRNTTALTDTQIKKATKRDKDYVLSDGKGLQLRVKKNGSKVWHFTYYRPSDKKRTLISLGNYPATSLADARRQREQARKLVTQGIDPKQHRDDERAQQQAEQSKVSHTLEFVAAQWLEKKRSQVSSDYADDIWRSLQLHVFPSLGDTPISDINAPQTIQELQPLEAQGKLESIKRVVQRLNEVMSFAVNTGLIHSNPLAGIKAAFDKPLKKNNPALTPEQLPELMTTLATSRTKVITRLLITWQLHTMTRPNEAAGARWDEIDLNAKVWTIPAERMKGKEGKRKEHRVPLTPQTIALLETIKPISGHREFIFPSDRDPKKPTNSQTANMALKRMGFKDKTTAHGMRALASTTLNAQGFNKDVIEAALAHTDKDEVRNAYNRTDYLERRIPMMC